ncbi:hypothetical protein BH23CHL4_BH23CHL4_15580 [soil metagenome]
MRSPLDADLAEYGALRAEIQSRAEFQHRLLQLHVSAMSALLGGAIVTDGNAWLICLIALEAAVFGAWLPWTMVNLAPTARRSLECLPKLRLDLAYNPHLNKETYGLHRCSLMVVRPIHNR